MSQNNIDKLRVRVAATRGLRKIRAEAELIAVLVQSNQQEALEIARASTKRARGLLHKQAGRRADCSAYKNNLAWILRTLAYSLRFGQHYEEAELHILEAVELFRQLEDHAELLRSQYVRHLLFRDQRRFAEALAVIEDALAVAQLTQHQQQDATLHGARGPLLSFLNRPDEALQAYEMAIDLAQNAGEFMTQMVALGDSATLYETRGQPAKAAANLRQVLNIDSQHGLLGKINLANVQWNLFRTEYTCGSIQEDTLVLLDKAIENSLEIGQTIQAAYQLYQRGLAQEIQGQNLAALQSLLRSLEFYQSGTHKLGIAMCKVKISGMLQSLDLHAPAQHFLDEAISYYNALEVHDIRSSDELRVGLTQVAKMGVAQLDYHKFLPLFKLLVTPQSGNRSMLELSKQLGLANMLQCTGDLAGAKIHYTEIIEVARKHGYNMRLFSCMISLGELLLKMGDPHAARKYLLEGARTADAHNARSLQFHALNALLKSEPDNPELLAQVNGLRQELFGPAQRSPAEALIQSHLRQEAEDQAEQLRQQLHNSQRQLAESRRALSARDAHISHLTERMEQIAVALQSMHGRRTENSDSLQDDLQELLRLTQSAGDLDSWKNLEDGTRSQDEKFLLRLAEKFPALTPSERKLCALIRLDNTTRDLCRLLNLSTRSVQVYRYRLRKKFGIDSSVKLSTFILEL